MGGGSVLFLPVEIQRICLPTAHGGALGLLKIPRNTVKRPTFEVFLGLGILPLKYMTVENIDKLLTALPSIDVLSSTYWRSSEAP